MKQVLIKQGQVVVQEVPAPQAEPGTVLVRVAASCISVGTELAGVRSSGQPLWKKALQNPQAVAKVIQMAVTQGVASTRSVVQGALEAGQPTGYSAAGEVVQVGPGYPGGHEFQPGDRVACAGAQCAHHAQYIAVPVNLTAPIPDGLDYPAASTVTLGAIAMQGVRRANPTLGECFVVVGLGLLGQLTVQLLKANGCRVLGIDPDPSRGKLAMQAGMDVLLEGEPAQYQAQVRRLTDGFGADGVIITAASSSDQIISTAFATCRKKGRVVVVGDVGLHLKRSDIYEKELDFFISTSYGPGRYDRHYEEEGLDYPIGYVRWTENRNMREYLRLLAEGKIKLDALVDATYPLDQAPQAYADLQTRTPRPLMVLLTYPSAPDKPDTTRLVKNPRAIPAGEGKLRLALVGAGAFAKGMHLPNLRALSDQCQVYAVVSRMGHNATATASQFGAAYATTDYQKVLQDPQVQAVLICTRHHLHGSMALQALRAGKHVLVEKPLALTQAELDAIADFYQNSQTSSSPSPVLLTGFNRRFSPAAQRIAQTLAGRSNPMILNYRMNAGYLPMDHWVHGPEGGGRNLGEACHIYDLFTFLTGAKVQSIQAAAISPKTQTYSASDNFIATMRFDDGSIASLTYTALGHADHPKETLEIFCDGQVILLEDYKRLQFIGSTAQGLDSRIAEKGHRQELEAFLKVTRQGGDWPISLSQQWQAHRIALEVEACLHPPGIPTPNASSGGRA